MTEHRLRRAQGFGGRWLGAAALKRSTGIDGAAGIRSRGNAQFDPYRACLGLVRAAEEDGALIFERSAVGRIKTDADRSGGRDAARDGVRESGGHRDRLRDAGIQAPGGALCHEAHLRAGDRSRLRRRRRARLGLDEVMLWDTARPYHYARWTPDHRLILGGGDRPQVPERRRASLFRKEIRALREHFDGLLPPLRGIAIESAWEGLFAMTPDGLPYIGPHRRYPRQLFALGYGGNGMTFGFLAARLLAERVLGMRIRGPPAFCVREASMMSGDGELARASSCCSSSWRFRLRPSRGP